MKMKKLNLIGIMAILLLTSLVSAATLTRTAPSTATPGQSISITYTASGVTGKWFAAWEDTISCNSQVVRAFLSSDLDLGATTKTVSFTAPSSGSCTLTGFYQFTDTSQINFPSATITIGNQPCTPDNSCASSTCTGQTCTNNCGTVIAGTKSCTTCTPNWQCSSWSACVSSIQTRTCVDINSCGVTTGKPTESQSCTVGCTSISCASSTCTGQTCTNNCGTVEQGTKACIPPSYCEFTQKFNWIEIVTDDCTNGLYNLIGLIVLILLGVSLLK